MHVTAIIHKEDSVVFPSQQLSPNLLSLFYSLDFQGFPGSETSEH